MMYLASEARNKELEDQLEKANETNEKMQRKAAAFKSKKQVVQNAIGDILQSFNAVLTNHTEKRKVFSNRQLHIIFRDVENEVDPTVSALIKACDSLFNIDRRASRGASCNTNINVAISMLSKE